MDFGYNRISFTKLGDVPIPYKLISLVAVAPVTGRLVMVNNAYVTFSGNSIENLGWTPSIYSIDDPARGTWRFGLFGSLNSVSFFIVCTCVCVFFGPVFVQNLLIDIFLMFLLR